VRRWRRLGLAASLAAAGSGCAGLAPTSHPANPVGWPAKGFAFVGHHGRNTEVPLVREIARILFAAGDVLESPALFLEGLVTLCPDKLAGAAEKLAVGLGGSVTAALNAPFFFVFAGNVDIGRDAGAVNDALAHIEQQDPASWRNEDRDDRSSVFPKGTRVRESGRNLIWTIPGEGEVVQAAEVSVLFSASELVAGTSHRAQERSWGMILSFDADWDERSRRDRAKTIVHEFYHQHAQLRRWFRGWTLVYWPAYGVTYVAEGWEGHWAEAKGAHSANAVDRALSNWEPGRAELSP